MSAIKEVVDGILRVALRAVDSDLHGNGRGSDRYVPLSLEPSDLVLDDRFRSSAKALNALRFLTDSVPLGPLILGVPIPFQIRPHGLVTDELVSKRSDVDTRPFEPASGRNAITGGHILVGEEPVVVRGFAVKVGHSSLTNCGTQEFSVEVGCELSQAPPIFVSRPQVLELFAE
ncbi:hypothetical protein C461_00602 [Halorubrum aidingense JCM 13560]|uniref:Uncharacterized protein n=1 Tax=Halorubrum aidingense JCM 13560 TaxID=1230454 RepID=M0PLC8_9EURY|nr:hypothetical protein C461_00602 [Halorubrum aidingense JCM 13560]